MNIFKKDGELTSRCEKTIFQIYERIEILSLFNTTWETDRIKFYGKFWRNKGRNLDDSAYRRLCELLYELNDFCVFGNDGKFGGKENDFIIVSEKMEKFLKWSFKKSKNSFEFKTIFKIYLKIKML